MHNPWLLLDHKKLHDSDFNKNEQKRMVKRMRDEKKAATKTQISSNEVICIFFKKLLHCTTS